MRRAAFARRGRPGSWALDDARPMHSRHARTQRGMAAAQSGGRLACLAIAAAELLTSAACESRQAG
ncbi:hypothetical protein BN2475_120170 [Paraburkholderia ribeironis]|uniref:Uncharacterized protein n=1 Tax=Paraburkholderia ribeironis TaxID=1247936 RepID=A0A1N7RRM9_9BURK|nr:hypothetical protein BN2475_120170 [Paraburkholderia ribeironis]